MTYIKGINTMTASGESSLVTDKMALSFLLKIPICGSRFSGSREMTFRWTPNRALVACKSCKLPLVAKVQTVRFTEALSAMSASGAVEVVCMPSLVCKRKRKELTGAVHTIRRRNRLSPAVGNAHLCGTDPVSFT